MKTRWFGFVLAVAGIAVACGEGLVILNVDVYSFIQGTGEETFTYPIPPGNSNVTASNTPQRFSLPGGLSCSVVNSVEATGAADLINTGATATLGFQIYIAADSAGTLQASALAVDVPAVTVSGANPTPVAINIPLTQALSVLFTEPQLWMRAGVQGTASNPGLLPVQGRGTLTAFDLRVVIQDEVC